MLWCRCSERSILSIKRDKILTFEEAKKKLAEYLVKHCKPERKYFLITDPVVANWFPRNFQAEADQDQEEIGQVKIPHELKASLEEVWGKANGMFSHMYRITNHLSKKSELRMGHFKGMQIIAEKAHNKNITRVIGLE